MQGNGSANDGALHYGRRGIDGLYARVWGDSIHFGIYPSPEITLDAAVMETKRRMAGLAGLGAGQRVLEVASGWGATARYLARAHGVHVTASNLMVDHLLACRGLAILYGLSQRIESARADFQSLPFADACFDVWWCQEATVHARDKRAVFAEAFRVLRPGGRIVFSDQTTIRARCTPSVLDRLSARHGSDDLYSAGEFMHALESAGFADVACIDLSEHMARHFANLLRRMDDTMAALQADFDAEILADNYALWELGRSLAESGAIGWSVFHARKADNGTSVS